VGWALFGFPLAAQSPPSPARYAVVLDASHGGEDTGGHTANWSEKSFTLALSVRLRSQLGARGITVITTRESDAAVEPERRAQIANHANAQACLSLHATQTGAGIHLFVSSLAPAPSTRLSAWKTAQSAAVTRSLALAGVVNSVLLHANLPVTLGRTSLPTLDSMTCPAIAIEIAPIRPGAHLDDPAYQAQIAESLAAAMLEWKTEDRQP
jgi:N-acetylmuramoyl-L-alanine amidase